MKMLQVGKQPESCESENAVFKDEVPLCLG
jgi:hypothetical protein